MTTTTDRVEAAARRIKQLQSEVADREEQIEDLKNFIDANTTESETVVGNEENGFLKIIKYQSRQFNEAWGKKNRPDLWEKYAVTKFVLDSATAKKVLSEEDYAIFQKPGKVTVKVDTIDD